ncbi:hypothetical protein PENTCL1PPCAC_3911 [Pristionchus entomophagus]|uniref:Uncharacterized protein n=1 Tax=Pristionchus entomophagus TaxID=358040 RepID=A0AAV5SEG3_9BILA|nr:hypothetical protein PENTCL1PPCAC_3911 [Pristionchus entomophagus]
MKTILELSNDSASKVQSRPKPNKEMEKIISLRLLVGSRTTLVGEAELTIWKSHTIATNAPSYEASHHFTSSSLSIQTSSRTSTRVKRGIYSIFLSTDARVSRN